MRELNVNIPCSVTRELVIEVADMRPDIFRDQDGNLILEAVLFALGFKIKPNAFNRGIYMLKATVTDPTPKEVWVRDNKNPYRVYQTIVYNGSLRKRVNDVLPCGTIIYDRNEQHPLGELYRNTEILQASDLSEWMDEDCFAMITDIGDKDYYDWGMSMLDKPSNGSSKNVVRSV